MVKIKTSLLVSYAIIIGLTLVLSSFLVFVFSNIEGKYRAMSENLILEYRITETFSQMIDSYTSLLQEPNNKEYLVNYTAAGKSLDAIFLQLNNTITFPASQEIYSRIKNIAVSVKKDCDTSLSDLSSGTFSQGTGVYDRAVRGKSYVRDNTADLILKELEYSKELLKQLQTLRTFSLISSFIFVLLIVSGSIVYGVRYSNKLSGTILKLSGTAESISKGNFNIGVSKDLLERNDEIGSLSQSFDRMVQNLSTVIADTNKKNDELDRMNKLMIGREMRMIELKDEIAKLKSSQPKQAEVSQKDVAKTNENNEPSG